MKTFINYYKSIDLNSRINLKGIGAMLNPWLHGTDCPYLENIKKLQHLDVSFARLLKNDETTFTNCGSRIFFTIDWNSPIRPAFDILNQTCKNHYKRNGSMYPANSFEYLNIGNCNH